MLITDGQFTIQGVRWRAGHLNPQSATVVEMWTGASVVSHVEIDECRSDGVEAVV
jgi:hypothetical protein